ncbi:MAG: PrsW family intramembrane metalloprotease, partial [Candidatus Xenobia bacterium]
MSSALIVTGAVLPAVLLLLLYNRGRRSFLSLAVGMGAGFLIGMPAAAVIESHLRPEIQNLAAYLAFCFGVAGGVEELCKLAAYKLVPARTRWVQDEDDVMLFAMAVSLGFAASENIFYGLRDPSLLMLRAFTAIPAHGMFGIVLGYGLSRARRQRDGTDWEIGAWLGAALCHGAYDAIAFRLAASWQILLPMVALAALCVHLLHARWTPPRATSPDRTLRNPWFAACCSLLPGGGQLYNRQFVKAAVFFAVAVVNVALTFAAYELARHPGPTLLYLLRHGLAVPAHLGRLSTQLQSALPWLIGLGVAWWLLAGFEAWQTARRRGRVEEPTMLTG